KALRQGLKLLGPQLLSGLEHVWRGGLRRKRFAPEVGPHTEELPPHLGGIRRLRHRRGLRPEGATFFDKIFPGVEQSAGVGWICQTQAPLGGDTPPPAMPPPAKLGTTSRNWPRQFGGATSRARHPGAALRRSAA